MPRKKSCEIKSGSQEMTINTCKPLQFMVRQWHAENALIFAKHPGCLYSSKTPIKRLKLSKTPTTNFNKPIAYFVGSEHHFSHQKLTKKCSSRILQWIVIIIKVDLPILIPLLK